MKRGFLVIAIIALAAGGVWGVKTWAGWGQPSGTIAPAGTTPAAGAAVENVIWASGKLVPTSWAGLGPAAGGRVKTVYAAEGQRVEAGTLLVELDAATIQRQAGVAQAALGEARAARDRLLAGATAEQLKQAEADVATAQANVAVAQAAVEAARRGSAAAEAQVAIAQAQYDELASRPTPAEVVAARREVDLTAAAVKQAQSSYDRVKGDPQIAARPEALQLEQSTLRYNAAQAAYDVATQGATPQQLAVAQAQVRAAQSQALVAAGQAPSAEAGVQAANAQLARAQAALAALQAGPTPEDRAMAESKVASAQAALAVAEAQLEETRVVAPFAGQIGSISARPGELAVPGQPLVMLGDSTRLRVETTDLRETDVSRLKLGMPVEVTFDALSSRKFQGAVSRIAPMSTTDKGSTNYTVIVDVADLDPALRWGMTAFVNIQTQ